MNKNHNQEDMTDSKLAGELKLEKSPPAKKRVGANIPERGKDQEGKNREERERERREKRETEREREREGHHLLCKSRLPMLRWSRVPGLRRRNLLLLIRRETAIAPLEKTAPAALERNTAEARLAKQQHLLFEKVATGDFSGGRHRGYSSLGEKAGLASLEDDS